MFNKGDWVRISQSYRDLEAADQGAYYGEIVSASGESPYRVHCNNDEYHWFFNEELSLLPMTKETT